MISFVYQISWYIRDDRNFGYLGKKRKPQRPPSYKSSLSTSLNHMKSQPKSTKMSHEVMLSFTVVMCLVCLVNSDLCDTSPAYSVSICKAVALHLQRQCNTAEVQALRRRATILQSAVHNMRLQMMNSACQGFVYRDRCYFILDGDGMSGMMTRDDAETACQNQSGHLVSIGDKQLYDFLYGYIETCASDIIDHDRDLVLVWTGASYLNGQVRLRDNTPTDFAEWNPHHPLNIAERNRIALAVAADPNTRGMFDTEPFFRCYPLCEKDYRN